MALQLLGAASVVKALRDLEKLFRSKLTEDKLFNYTKYL